MEATLAKLEIQEKDLELIISDKTLGSLTTNAKDIKALVEQSLPNYDIKNYSEDNIETAKKDKAMLNNASKVLNAKRIEIEKEFMKPFIEFKDIIAETVKLISECSSKIDVVVKESDHKEKETKRGKIVDLFDKLNFALVPLEKFFDEKWLNKTVKEKTIETEINAKIAEIKDGLSTLEAIGEDVETLKAMYLDNLNINETIKYSNTLKLNREKLQPKAVEVPAEPVKEIPVEAVANIPVPVAEPVTGTAVTPELLIRTMKVTTTLEKLIALGDFMNANGILFEKL
jgi:hypothetical protein